MKGMRNVYLLAIVLLVLGGCAKTNSDLEGLENTGWSITEKANKAVPVADDVVGIEDSAASYAIKNVKFKDFPLSDPAKTYNDATYVPLSRISGTVADDTNISTNAGVVAYVAEHGGGTGSGLETLPTVDDTFLKGTGAGTYAWTSYDSLKASLGVPVVGTDVYAISAIDALLTPTAITGKLANQIISPAGLEIAPNSTGSQIIILKGDTDLGQGEVGIAAPQATTNSFLEVLPIAPPTEGQIKLYHAPGPITGADGIIRQGAQAYYENPAVGVLIEQQGWPSGLDPALLNNLSGSSGNIQAQIDSIPGLVWDTYPEYEDSPHVTGIARNATDFAIYVPEVDRWGHIPITFDIGADPGGPIAQSFVISGPGPQYGTVTYDRNVTATTTAGLCSDWAVTMANAGLLTLGYAGGDGTTEIVCSLPEHVYSDDTVVSSVYTPGTIKSTPGDVALVAIADFSAETSNISSESPPIGSCGTSTMIVNDGFSGDFSGFAQDSGTWSIAGDGATQGAVSGTARFLRSTTALTSDCQWAKTLITNDFTSGTSPGFILRASGVTGNKYVIRFTYGSPNVFLTWATYNGTTNLGLNIANVTIPTANIVVGTVLMAQVYGAGVGGTTVKIWLDPTGATPSESGDADYTLVSDQGTAVDTGVYAGIFSLDTAAPIVHFDYFQAGN